jgi:predicted ester cyclase
MPTGVGTTPSEEPLAPPGSALPASSANRRHDPAGVARRLVEEVLNAGDLAAVDELLAPHFHDHSPRPGQGPGRTGYKVGLRQSRRAFPDLVHVIDELLVAGDRVVLRLTVRGTHHGSFLGLPPTHRRVQVGGVIILRLAGGRIVERWSLGDDLGLLLQLSPVAPPTGQARSVILGAYPHLPAARVVSSLN